MSNKIHISTNHPYCKAFSRGSLPGVFGDRLEISETHQKVEQMLRRINNITLKRQSIQMV
jgi:hypothetical protein